MAYEELAQHCLELLAPLGDARARRMFGGQGIWLDDLFIAVIAEDRVYLKTDALTRPNFVAAGCEPFVYDRARQKVALGYWSAPAEAVDSPAQMQPWARLAIEAALRARSAKPMATRAKPRAKASAPAATTRQAKGGKASRGR